ncbi:unnamed protein product [Brassicogethes aeneus]|uniref:Mitochondrial 28S ribosomal protein S27 n=1 Tax=Brassicogethes aeneus TaxID=1431903 RepID=A0A9P0FMK2_BRAAE|nr:unnamed protein product [Brassicogethes aeneus]
MLKIITFCSKTRKPKSIYTFSQLRTFLSPAYYCNEVWEHRLNSPVLQKVNPEDLYNDVDQRYQKLKQISAVDVDIFTNSVNNNQFNGEILDLVHKLRLSADAYNALDSTSHAVIRTLMNYGNKSDLVDAIDDRLNYGLFLDSYTANLLLDTFWKERDYLQGARVASQIMLQEDFGVPLTDSLCLLHCYKYLEKPSEWPKYETVAEPEDEVKVRVKYLRNPYDDDHFDLRDSNKIIGKTLVFLTKGKDDVLSKSFNVLGLALFGKNEEAAKVASSYEKPLCKEVISLLPEDNKLDIKTESLEVEKLLISEVEKNINTSSETDIAKQCEVFSQWEQKRIEALNEQQKRYETQRRLETVKDLKEAIKEKETKLWFFENEEQIELDIMAKRVFYPKKWFGKKKKPRKIDEGYVPPEIRSRQES